MVVGVAAVVELDDDGTVAAGSGGARRRGRPAAGPSRRSCSPDLLGAARRGGAARTGMARAGGRPMLHPDDDVARLRPVPAAPRAVARPAGTAEAAARARGDGEAP